MGTLIRRLIEDERGQDLVEYALLSTVIGLSSIAVFDVIRAAINTVYGGWNSTTNGHFRPPDPGAGGS